MPAQREIGFAIVGCGSIGRVHAAAVAAVPGARLVAVSGRSSGGGPALADRYGARWYPDYREMMRRGDLDVVNICTPSGAHLDPALAAAAAGKHVVCEKPLEVTLPRTDEMIAACERARVKLAAVFPLRFSAATRLTAEAVRAGRLGRLIFAEARVPWWRSQEYYDSGGWRGTWALDGGGALMNQAIHRVDLLQALAGPVARVCAATGTVAHERVEVEDLAVGILRFASGALGSVVASTAFRPGFPATIALYGTRGAVELEEHAITVWKIEGGTPEEERDVLARFRPSGGGPSSDPMNITNEGHAAQIADMVAAVREGRGPAVDGREGRRAIATIVALYESARGGDWTDVDGKAVER